MPAIMDQPSAEIEGVLRTTPLDHSLLVLNPDTEAFFKAETGIQDIEKLREHIIGVQKEAFKVSLYVSSPTPSGTLTLLCSAVSSIRILAFVHSDSQGSRSLGCPHTRVPLNC